MKGPASVNQETRLARYQIYCQPREYRTEISVVCMPPCFLRQRRWATIREVEQWRNRDEVSTATEASREKHRESSGLGCGIVLSRELQVRHTVGSFWLGPFVDHSVREIIGVPGLPSSPPFHQSPFFLLPKGPLSGRIFHKELLGSVLPALQDEPDILPGFAPVASFYDNLVGCREEVGEGQQQKAAACQQQSLPFQGLFFGLRPPFWV